MSSRPSQFTRLGRAVALFGLLLSSPTRADDALRLCTDRGGLVATVSAEGIEGVLNGRWRVHGTRDALAIQSGEDVLWRGSLDALSPRPAPSVDPVAIAERFQALVPGLTARGDSVRGLGFKGRVDEHGVLRGTWDDGRSVAYALGLDERSIFGGSAPAGAPLARIPGAIARGGSHDPLTAGHPPTRAGALGRVVTEHLRAIDVVAGCPLAGPDRLWVGAWPHPQPLGSGERVTYVTDDQALVRGPQGVAWYGTLPIGRDHAASLAAELRDAFPDRSTAVAWEDGRALVVVASGGRTVMGDVVEPTPGGPMLLPFLPIDPAEPDPAVDAVSQPHQSGAEMLARVNAIRREADLPELAWDEDLAWSALAQCTYLDWTAASGLDDGWHFQDPSSPVFVGRSPADRGGADEVAGRDRAQPPWRMVDRWIAAPFHRDALLDPRATRAGGCATPGGAHVLEIRRDTSDVPVVRTWPVAGQPGVPLAFDGREDPDPLPADAHPSKELPLGYTLTVWVDAEPERVRVVSTRIEDAHGEPLAHHVVSASTHPVLSGGAETAVHLIAARPFAPEMEHRWTVEVEVDGEARRVARSFTSGADPAATAASLTEDDARLLLLTNAARSARDLGPLEPTAMAHVAATLYADTRAPDAVRRLLRAEHAWWTCVPEADLAAMADEPERLDALLLEPRADWIGFARRDGEACVLATTSPTEPAAWRVPTEPTTADAAGP